MKVILFGSSKYIIPTIKMLHEEFELILVVTTEKNPTDAVPSFCTENKIPFLSVSTLKDQNVLEKIKNHNAEIGILGYFGLIVPQELLGIFPKGIINIHPSLLPLYRGPTPVQTALLNGDKETGVSIILLDNKIDHGPILAQKSAAIYPEDTTDSLHERLFKLGTELIKDVLPKYINADLKPITQNHQDATFTNELSRSDAQIDADSLPDKEKLDRMIRAYHPWPGVWGMVRIKNQESRIKLLPNSSLRGSKGDEAIHSKYLLQVEGGRPMTIKDFLNGYPEASNDLKKIIG